jgi:enoyl-CoA hydratase/carnithine racemase
MTSEVLYSVVDRVATITLNRPEKLNAWTSRMQVQLRKRLRAGDECNVIGFRSGATRSARFRRVSAASV